MGRQLTDSFITDTGPTVAQALGAEAAVNNLQITIGAGLGARVFVDWEVDVNNEAAVAKIITAGPAIGGVLIANASQTNELPASATASMTLGGHIIVVGTVAAQVLTIRAATSAGAPTIQPEAARLRAVVITQAVSAEPVLSSP